MARLGLDRRTVALGGLGLLVTVGAAMAVDPAGLPPGMGQHPVWFWSLMLFGFCLVLGVVAVIAGVGGGVLYVPLVDALFPFGLDFVRGAGLLIAVSGALSSGPELLRKNLASLRLAIPCALLAAVGATVGARLGLALDENLVKTLLGLVVIAIAFVMMNSRQAARPADDGPQDPLGRWLNMAGSYVESSTGQVVRWQARRVASGLVLIFFIGVLGGMFGVGAGWAKVPTLNLLMGVPLKVAAASSVFLISLGDVSGAWIYLNRGSVLPVVVVPSTVGLMLGAKVGARLLDRTKPAVVRKVVVTVLLIAGVRTLLDGLGVLGGGR